MWQAWSIVQGTYTSSITLVYCKTTEKQCVSCQSMVLCVVYFGHLKFFFYAEHYALWIPRYGPYCIKKPVVLFDYLISTWNASHFAKSSRPILTKVVRTQRSDENHGWGRSLNIHAFFLSPQQERYKNIGGTSVPSLTVKFKSVTCSTMMSWSTATGYLHKS